MTLEKELLGHDGLDEIVDQTFFMASTAVSTSAKAVMKSTGCG